ncbi:LysR family transcriptional regulator [Cupriavidus pauculus]|uniref:LysR family transcriptional regulator n=1 Tax=Cupriavidus pauculus TaxID=82633 RepID=A0A5P2H2A0_9BURK|nr:LysR family transcriptional regulator [Cupriavidus pauculus]QET02167.1 LysR family transcriptional regulator [Cupriavidus pauculus]
MIENLAALRVFVRVARKRSFSAGARDMNLPQPTVSRMIAALEREIGTPLLTRTTRAVVLTDAGIEFLSRVESILAQLDEAEQAARGTHALRGVLRVGTSASFASRELLPALPVFRARHPQLSIELLVDDYRQDLVTENVDVAFRFGVLPNSSAMARRLAVWPCILVASPVYLAHRGMPATPADLGAHEVIVGPAPAGRTWTFTQGGKQVSVEVKGSLAVTNAEVGIQAALAGQGIVAAASHAFEPDLSEGRLIQLLPSWQMAMLELNAVFAAGKRARPAAKALADHIAGRLTT